VFVGVTVGVSVKVGVGVELSVFVGVAVGVGELYVAVVVGVGVSVGVSVIVGVGVGVSVGVSVIVGVGVGVGYPHPDDVATTKHKPLPPVYVQEMSGGTSLELGLKYRIPPGLNPNTIHWVPSHLIWYPSGDSHTYFPLNVVLVSVKIKVLDMLFSTNCN
jgi:hypothetical protein